MLVEVKLLYKMKIQLGSFELPDSEGMYLKVSVKIGKVSLRGYIAECVKGNLLRMRNLYRDRIEVEAQRLGITWEECFNLYLSYDEPYTAEKIAEAKLLPALIRKNYGQTSLGNEAKNDKS